MSDKLDRVNLRRHARRTESYSSLLSKRKGILTKSNLLIKKSRTDTNVLKLGVFTGGNKEYEDEENNKENNKFPSETSSTSSSSSDSSQDFKPNLLASLNVAMMQCKSSQHELELTSVMTRSATKKYASVGAIHNKVNFDRELKVMKRWESSISYPIPSPPVDHCQLKDIISKSFNEIMSFCKYSTLSTQEEPDKCREKVDPWKTNEDSLSFIDLTPYLTQEPVVISGNNETQITLHLNDSIIPHQLINVISFNGEEQNSALVIQEENTDYETITLHSDETYFLDNKYLYNGNSVFFRPEGINILKNTFLPDPMIAIHNDHNYAKKNTPEVSAVDTQLSQSEFLKKEEKLTFNLENALNDLLLNTAILKCLICGETPQEIISLLDIAQTGYQ